METLKYKIIASEKQYDRYCKTLEQLVFSTKETRALKDEIALLTLLIEKYDKEHSTLGLAVPVALWKSLMKDHKMKAVDLARLPRVSEGLVSDMHNYKKGLSKETICILSEKFKFSQEAFNRSYKLQVPSRHGFKGARPGNSRKKLITAS
jgi:HTH-type transcriptional regulator / antitoxin HigA